MNVINPAADASRHLGYARAVDEAATSVRELGVPAMPEVETSYLTLAADAQNGLVRAVEVIPGELLVDVLPDGRIAGIERIGGPVDMGAVLAVLRAVPLRPERDALLAAASAAGCSDCSCCSRYDCDTRACRAHGCPCTEGS